MKEQSALIELVDGRSYIGMETMQFPVRVNATMVKKDGHVVGFYVTGKDLIKRGAKKSSFRGSHRYFFFRDAVGHVSIEEKKRDKRRKPFGVSYSDYSSDTVAVSCACAMVCL